MVFFAALIILGTASQSAFADRTLIARMVEDAPVIDGQDNDTAWNAAAEIITHDAVADIDITLRAVYTDKEIFFLVGFPDPDESRTHKSWTWDKNRAIYVIGNDREDGFSFKWNMEPGRPDLSIYADNPYKADVWFWKACRTDPAGYADDKMHVLSPVETEYSTELTSRGGRTMYLLRREDEGRAAYKTELPVEYKGDLLSRFFPQTPSSSRADVKAEGVWKDGRWTVEFGRSLDTGNDDDVLFDKARRYHFGVSRYHITGRGPDPELTQPLYGSGDISEGLILVFESGDLKGTNPNVSEISEEP